MKKALALLFLLQTFPVASSEGPGTILVLTIEGVINPVIGSYVEESLQKAERQRAAAVLIELNTPGGLLDATRSINSAIINSPVPVIVYVAPRGSRATSAGLFITMASDVAAMAPETHIGAAHPVTITGEGGESSPKENVKKKGDQPEESSRSVMSEKMVSDAAAYIRTLAAERGRNATWAEKAVRESVSLTSTEALEQNVVDLLASSQEELIEKLNGRKIIKDGKHIVLNFKDASVQIVPMSWSKKLLHRIAHPNVAYILMTIGIYGLIYELASPGIGLGGGVGLICLLLAFFSLQVLPINTVGIALIAAGVALLFLDLLTPTHGLLTFAGLMAFALGSFMLIDIKMNPGYARVSIELILSTVVATALFFGFAVRKVFQAKRMKPTVGSESLLGSVGVAKTNLTPEGMVYSNGELWSARADSPVNADEEVVIIGLEGNKLIVKKK